MGERHFHPCDSLVCEREVECFDESCGTDLDDVSYTDPRTCEGCVETRGRTS